MAKAHTRLILPATPPRRRPVRADRREKGVVARRKLTVNLSEELVDVLKELAERNDTTMTDELKKAIQDRKYFADKVRAGNDVILEREVDEKVERTLVDLR